MKIQIVVTLSTDGYLTKWKDQFKWCFFSNRHGLPALIERADIRLHKNESLLSLLAERQNSPSVIYLVEAVPDTDTLNFIKGLLLYRLADELILYSLSEIKKYGMKLSLFISLSEWNLVKEHRLRGGIHCKVYKRKK